MESARDLVDKIRLGSYTINANDPSDMGPNGDGYFFILDTSEAPALIEADRAAIRKETLENVWISLDDLRKKFLMPLKRSD
jgi:hypothetical protein